MVVHLLLLKGSMAFTCCWSAWACRRWSRRATSRIDPSTAIRRGGRRCRLATDHQLRRSSIGSCNESIEIMPKYRWVYYLFIKCFKTYDLWKPHDRSTFCKNIWKNESTRKEAEFSHLKCFCYVYIKGMSKIEKKRIYGKTENCSILPVIKCKSKEE